MSNLQRLGLIAVFALAATIFTLGAVARWGEPEQVELSSPTEVEGAALEASPLEVSRSQAPQSFLPLTGRVRFGDGSGASGAEVIVIEGDLAPAAALEAAAEGDESKVVARATADTDGTFRVLLDPNIDRLQLVARASLGYAPSPLALERGGASWEACEIELERGADLVIAAGPPGPVTVRADLTEGSMQPRGTPVGSRRFVLERDASLVVIGLRPGVALEVVASPTDAAPVRERLRALEPGETRTLVLSERQGELFAGRVVDSDGTGVAGAVVRLTWPVEPGRRGDEVSSTSTSEGGRFELRQVPATELVGQVVAEGYALLDFWVPAPGPGRNAGGFVLELGAGARLGGRVTLPDGGPAVGASIEVVAERGESARASEPEARRAVSDEKGRFEVAGLEGRRFKLSARLERAGERELRAVARSVEPDIDLALELVATVDLEVLARGPGGEPVTELEIVGALMDSRNSVQAAGQEFEMDGVDAQGLHRAAGLMPGSWQVSLSARGLGPIDDLVVALPRSEPLVVDFEAAATVSGRVVGPDGTPLAGGRVLAWTTRPLGFAVRARERETAMTDADGRFELRQLRPGRLFIRARHPSFATSDWREFELGAGGRLSDVELQVRTGAVLTGRVLDAAGAPMAQRWVVCHAVESWDPVRVRTDIEGRFRIESLVPGEWQVIALGLEDDDPGMVSVTDLQMAHVTLEDGRTHYVELGGVASTGAVLEGVIAFAPSGRNNWIQARSDGGSGILLAKIQDDGSFHAAAPSAGRYLVSVLLDKGVDRGSELYFTTAVSAEESNPIIVDTVSASIGGQIVDATGKGLAGVPVRLEYAGHLLAGEQLAMRFAFDVSGDDGRFAFLRLPPGTYRVTAGGLPYTEGGAPKARWSVAIADTLALADHEQRLDLELVVGEPRSVVGSVVDESGRAIGAATIYARTERGALVHELALVRSEPDGHFRYDGLPPGPIAFSAVADGWASGEQRAVEGLELRLEAVASGSLVVEFACPSGGVLSLRDELGNELAGREDLRDATSEEGQRWHASRVDFDDLAPGRYTVELLPFIGTPQTKYVQVAAGAERRVVFTAR